MTSRVQVETLAADTNNQPRFVAQQRLDTSPRLGEKFPVVGCVYVSVVPTIM
ncbi:MAG: hypothetical protein ABSF35_21465 [Polyangia bacterium]